MFSLESSSCDITPPSLLKDDETVVNHLPRGVTDYDSRPPMSRELLEEIEKLIREF